MSWKNSTDSSERVKFIDDWLKDENILFPIFVRDIKLAEVQVDYETRWITYVIPLQDIHIHRLARVDLKYDVNAESKIISKFIKSVSAYSRIRMCHISNWCN